jgi:mannose-6-phosphate isomerase-like protein (cupin superfamily)
VSVTEGEGWALGHLDDLGEGHGFRKIRGPLGVTAFGINALVIPAGYTGRGHYHEHQEETYFLHSGRLEIGFGDGSVHELVPGSIARVDARTVRGLRNPGDEDAVVLVVGGKDGYVERDGQTAEVPGFKA